MIPGVSDWFRAYRFANVHEDLIVGALPLDDADVRTLSGLGVVRVLNLVQDSEYGRGTRRKVERALAKAEIDEHRISCEDYGNLSPELLDEATALVNTWLDDGETVYLHCRAGWQRSAAVAAGALALREGVSVDAALAHVQTMKASADPLPHQREDLQRWWQARRPEAQPRRSA